MRIQHLLLVQLNTFKKVLQEQSDSFVGIIIPEFKSIDFSSFMQRLAALAMEIEELESIIKTDQQEGDFYADQETTAELEARHLGRFDD